LISNLLHPLSTTALSFLPDTITVIVIHVRVAHSPGFFMIENKYALKDLLFAFLVLDQLCGFQMPKYQKHF